MIIKKDIKNYITKLKKNIHCDRKIKREFIKNIKNSIYELINKEDNVNINMIENEIGSIEEIVYSFNEENTEYILKHKKNLITLCIIIAILLLITFLLIVILHIFLNNYGFFFKN